MNALSFLLVLFFGGLAVWSINTERWADMAVLLICMFFFFALHVSVELDQIRRDIRKRDAP